MVVTNFMKTLRLMTLSIVMAAVTSTAAIAQTISPNGKVEWREKGNGFSVVYHQDNEEKEVLDIPMFGVTTKDGGGKNLHLKEKYDAT